MLYRNTRTGATLESDCQISGGEWVRDYGLPPLGAKPQPETAPQPKPKRARERSRDQT